MATVQRFDRAEMQTDGVDPSTGILRGRATLAKEGVYLYGDGTRTWSEYTPLSTLTDPEYLDSMRMNPVTLDHPAGGVNADNAKAHAVGSIGDTVLMLRDRIGSPITVWDRAAVKAAQTTHTEISQGYWADIDDTPGEWNGQRYDTIQVKRRSNHTALVQQGRHGADVRLHLDSASVIGAGFQIAGVDTPHQRTDSEDKMPHPIKLGERTIEVADAATAAAVQAHVDAQDAKIATLAEVTARADRAEADRDAAVQRFDAAAKGDKCDACGAPLQVGKYAADARDAEVRARLDLETKAAKVCGADWKADGKTDRQIRVDMLAKLGVTVADDKTDDYINARLDGAMERTPTAASVVADALNASRKDGAAPVVPFDANDALSSQWA